MKTPVKLTPKQAMALAIEEGRKGAGFVSPNPLVGCVILDRDSYLIGHGCHERYGGPHAEIHALLSVSDQARLDGAHIYVTLEPCAHEGKTGSCAKALAKLPIAAVTFGLIDPNPLVSGKGAEILRQAGKKVEAFSEMQNELEDLAEIFLMNFRKKRPFVSLKLASSFDGQVALGDGTSKWITGEASREKVQHLRGCHDAVLVGVGTFLSDNPRLNSRTAEFKERPQRAVILDPQGKCFSRLADSALLSVRPASEVFVVTKPGVSPSNLPIQHLQIAFGDDGFDLDSVLACLSEKGIHSILVEGGAHTYSAFLKKRLADRLYLFIAPKLMGKGLGWTSGLTLAGLDQTIDVERLSVQTFGPDWMFSGRLRYPTKF